MQRTLLAAVLMLCAAPRVSAQDIAGGEEPRTGSATDDAFPGLDRATLRRLALAAGPVRVRGRAHLAGRVFAEDFRVEPGAEVTIEAGTAIYSVGDIRIDAPLRGVAAAIRGAAKTANPAATGDAGASTPDITFVCEQGDFVQSETILMVDGGAGQSVSLVGTSGQGGPGGKGGGIRIDCPGTVTINANIVPGRGGRGGSADILGAAGQPGRNGKSVRWACGGAGGNSGDVRIVAHKLVFLTDSEGKLKGKIALRPGGVGGEATSRGGAGGDAAALFRRAGHGGDALARGGKAGRSTRAFVQVDELEPSDVDAHDIAGFLETEHADGGAAHAFGGAGGRAIGIYEFTECFPFGFDGGKGGFGGSAVAYGGFGASGGQIGGGSGALRDRAQSAAETPPGKGGDADAHGGQAGAGGIGETASLPGRGGAGGNGGDAIARGGPGGSSSLGERFDQPLAGGQGPLIGGTGGSVTAVAGNGADGGQGGSCCEHPGGRGAPGGAAGAGGTAKAIQGRGGLGFTPGPIGAVNAKTDGADGEPGAKGADCEAAPDPKKVADLTIPGPVYDGAAIHFEVDVTNPDDKPWTGRVVALYLGSEKIHEWTVDVPARGMVHVSYSTSAPKLATGYTATVRIGADIIDREVFAVVRGPCSVQFSTTTLDFGDITADEVSIFFDVTNNNPWTVRVIFPDMDDGIIFFDPHDPTGTLWPYLLPGQKISVEVGFVWSGGRPANYSRIYTICGTEVTVRAHPVPPPP